MKEERFSIIRAWVFAWRTLKENVSFFLHFALILLIIYGLLALLEYYIQQVNRDIFTLLQLPVVILVYMTVIKIGLRFAAGGEAELKDLYPASSDYWSYAGGFILYLLIIVGGTFLLIVPGVVWATKYQFFGFLIIDHGVSPKQAITRSGEITFGEKRKILLFDLAYVVYIGLSFIRVSILQWVWYFLFPVFMTLFLLAMANVYKELMETEGSAEQAQYLEMVVDGANVSSGVSDS